MAQSKVSFRKWAIAIYLEMESPKGIASTRIARAIGVRQASCPRCRRHYHRSAPRSITPCCGA